MKRFNPKKDTKESMRLCKKKKAKQEKAQRTKSLPVEDHIASELRHLTSKPTLAKGIKAMGLTVEVYATAVGTVRHFMVAESPRFDSRKFAVRVAVVTDQLTKSDLIADYLALPMPLREALKESVGIPTKEACLLDLLEPYTFDAEGNPQTIE